MPRDGAAVPIRPTYIYLHGFCSSPGSSKAQFFKTRMAEIGHEMHVPDLNHPDFFHMTISSQVAVVRKLVEELGTERVVLWGSSMGAIVALLFASRFAAPWVSVERLVLMAPAFDLFKNLDEIYGPGTVEKWRRDGQIEVLHFADNDMKPIGYALYEDAQHYEFGELTVPCPVLIFHGTHDEVAAPAATERYVERARNEGRPVELVMLDSDHQLLDQPEAIWERVKAFLSDGP